MRNILTIAWTDLRIYLSDRGNLISLIILPVIMTLFLGGVFSGGGSSSIRMDLLDEDDSPRSQQFIAELRAVNPTLLICPLDQTDDNACGLDENGMLDRESSILRVQDGDTNALLVLPEGFGAAVAILEPLDLPYYSSANITTGDVVLESVNAVLQRVNGAVVAAQVGVGLGEELGMLSDDTVRNDLSSAVYEQANSLWANQSVTVTYTETQAESESSPVGGFGQSVPGMATFFVIFTVLAAGMNGLVRERKQGTLQRLAVLPLRRSEILAGKILMHFSIGMVQFLIVFLVGIIVGIGFGNDLVALILVMVVYTLCITALGLALAARVDNETQVSALTTLLGLVMAALGGAWWPLSIAPPFMQVIGHLTPVAWAMDAFQQLFFFNGGLGDVLLPIAVLAVTTVALFGLGVMSFKYDN